MSKSVVVWIARMGSSNNPNYFTGEKWSVYLADAKHYCIRELCECAVEEWNISSAEGPLPAVWWDTLEIVPVRVEIIADEE